MTTLNLIYPQQSDIPFRAMVFPDGQPHIKLDAESLAGTAKAAPLRILTRLAGSNDVLLALFLKNALDYAEFTHVELHVSYLMAARMDRVMQDGEPFSLKVMAALLNGAGFKKVCIFDPHSEVSTALIDRSYAVTNHLFVKDALKDYIGRNAESRYSLVSPDAGALKKIHKLAQALEIHDVIECLKERDVKTGRLIAFQTIADDLGGRTCFIIDDICDGGGTFAGTAKMLREKGAGKIVLVVSHGIFSKGTAIEGVDEVYCTDSYRTVPEVHCYPVGKYL